MEDEDDEGNDDLAKNEEKEKVIEETDNGNVLVLRRALHI